MNALTKVFVVVVTILSVVLVTLVVSFAARVPNYAQQFESMKQDRDAQLLRAQDAATEVRNQIASKGSELESALASISSVTAELDRANNDKKSLQAKLDQAQLTVSRSAAVMEIAAQSEQTNSQRLSQQAELIKQQLTALSVLQTQRGDLSQTLIETNSKVRNLSTAYMRKQKENKALEQQLLESQAALKAALDQFGPALADAGSESAPVPPPAGVDIRGSVTKIEQITDDLTFVQLNVGSRDLVKEGMEFTVYRGDKFVAKIQIASVDTAESVGQLTLVEDAVKEGDAALAGGR